MADLAGDIREALRAIKAHGPHSKQGSDAWLTLADVVRRIASQVRHATVRAGAIDADDVAASMLVRLQSEVIRQRIIAARSPAAYLRGMARFVLIDQLRKAGTTVPLESKQGTIQDIASPDVDDLIEVEAAGRGDAAVERLRAAIAALPPSEQMLVHQRFWEGMSVADIARGLGEPYSRVVVRMFRVIRKLRRALESR